MTLPPNDFNRMQYLLGKAKVQGLDLFEQDELRRYITIEQPSAQNSSLDDLIKFGLILVGIYLLAKALEE
jgi:hypothetical protein